MDDVRLMTPSVQRFLRLDYKAGALCLVAAPIGQLVGTFFYDPVDGGGVAGTVVHMLTCVLWIPAWRALYGAVRGRAPLYAVLGTFLGIYSTLVLLNYSSMGIVVSLAGLGPVHETIRSLGQSLGFAGVVLLFTGLLFPLQFPVLGAMLWRQRMSPSWVALSLVAGGLSFPPSRMFDMRPLAHASDVLLLVPLVYVGVRQWRMAERVSLTAP